MKMAPPVKMPDDPGTAKELLANPGSKEELLADPGSAEEPPPDPRGSGTPSHKSHGFCPWPVLAWPVESPAQGLAQPWARVGWGKLKRSPSLTLGGWGWLIEATEPRRPLEGPTRGTAMVLPTPPDAEGNGRGAELGAIPAPWLPSGEGCREL